MIKFLFLTIPTNSTYHSLSQPLTFPDDTEGVSNWVLRHPLTIYSHDLTFAHIFTHEGIQIQRVNSRDPKQILQQKWKYFVMTKCDGHRLYCTYHIFYEKGPLQSSADSYKQFYLPKCLILMSPQPYFKLMANLIKIYHHLRYHYQLQRHNQLTRTINEGDLLHYEKQQNNNDGIASINHHLSLHNNKTISCPIQIAFNYYIDTCNAQLWGRNQEQFKNMRFVQDNMEVLHLYNLQTDTLYRINYTMQLPIYGHTLVWVIAAILQQKQIIFISSNQNSNVLLMQTLLQMILPFKWECMFVPNLPPHMMQAAQESFMPYMVGIHCKLLKQLSTINRVLVHVDTNTLQYNQIRVGCEGVLSYGLNDGYYLQHEQKMLQLPYQLEQFITSIPCKQIRDRNNMDRDVIWESEVRIRSIMLMSVLISKVQNIGNSLFSDWHSSNYHPLYAHIRQKTMHYSVFTSNSEHGKGRKSRMHGQIEELKGMNSGKMRYYIEERMKKVNEKTSNFLVKDNRLQWMRYYCEHRQMLRETSLMRHSIKNLNLRLKQSLVQDTYSSMTNLYQKTQAHKKTGLSIHKNGNHSRNLNRSMDIYKPKTTTIHHQPIPQYHSTNLIHPSTINIHQLSPQNSVFTVSSARNMNHFQKVNNHLYYKSSANLHQPHVQVSINECLREKMRFGQPYVQKMNISLRDDGNGYKSVVENGYKSVVGNGYKSVVENGYKSMAENGYKSVVENGYKSMAENGYKSVVENGYKSVVGNGYKSVVENGYKSMAENGYKQVVENGYKQVVGNGKGYRSVVQDEKQEQKKMNEIGRVLVKEEGKVNLKGKMKIVQGMKFL